MSTFFKSWESYEFWVSWLLLSVFYLFKPDIPRVKELTNQQDEIYRMLRSHIAQHGFPPTRADICKHFGFSSPTTAADHLRALERRGCIELIPVTPRGIRLVERSDDSGLPIVGRVALGQPILSKASIERRIDIDPELFAPPADYLFRMVGEGMSGAGIIDGDLLAVHVTEQVRNGQIVVARINDEVTVKTFRQKGNIVTLSPENDEFEAIRVNLESIKWRLKAFTSAFCDESLPKRAKGLKRWAYCVVSLLFSVPLFHIDMIRKG